MAKNIEVLFEIWISIGIVRADLKIFEIFDGGIAQAVGKSVCELPLFVPFPKTGEALIFGNCVPMPLMIKITEAMPAPNSENCKIKEEWFKKDREIPAIPAPGA